MVKDHKVEMKSLIVISIVSFAIAIVLCLMIPSIYKLICLYFHSEFEFFLVTIYIYAIPLAFVLLGVSMIIIRKAILEDRFSQAWYIEDMRKGKREKKGGVNS